MNRVHHMISVSHMHNAQRPQTQLQLRLDDNCNMENCDVKVH